MTQNQIYEFLKRNKNKKYSEKQIKAYLKLHNCINRQLHQLKRFKLIKTDKLLNPFLNIHTTVYWVC